MNDINQQKIKLNENEINSTNNKNENDELNNIQYLSVFWVYIFLGWTIRWIKFTKMGKSKQRFRGIKKKVQNGKIKNLQARPKGGKVIKTNESNKLLHEIENIQITYEETLQIIENIRSDISKIILTQNLNPNQINVLNTIFMVNQIFTGESRSIGVNNEGNLEVFKEKSDKEKQAFNEKLDTTDMPELESEESAAERRNQPGKVLKILTSDQMLSRLPITLAQLKPGNN